MSEVKDVRAALERVGQLGTPEDSVLTPEMRWAYIVLQALVSEGLAACDELEDQAPEDDGTTPGFHEHVVYLRRRVHVFASILRKAGLLQ